MQKKYDIVLIKLTLIALSQPAEIATALSVGEHLTHETQSLWPSRTSTHLPTAFQTLTVLSLEAETNCLLEVEMETDKTSLV